MGGNGRLLCKVTVKQIPILEAPRLLQESDKPVALPSAGDHGQRQFLCWRGPFSTPSPSAVRPANAGLAPLVRPLVDFAWTCPLLEDIPPEPLGLHSVCMPPSTPPGVYVG